MSKLSDNIYSDKFISDARETRSIETFSGLKYIPAYFIISNNYVSTIKVKIIDL